MAIIITLCRQYSFDRAIFGDIAGKSLTKPPDKKLLDKTFQNID